MALLLMMVPAVTGAQTFELHGSAGPTMPDAGYSLAAGIGFTPTSRVTFVVDVERTHLSTQVETDARGSISTFRGGTVTLASAGLRVSLFGSDRVGPYAIAGLAAGVSRPNVTPTFPSRVTNDVRAPFFGGGFRVPLNEHLDLFADGRMMLVVGTDADELFAVAPIRAGVSWRF
jgi:hypothetical protein